jgi:hypothetical protein
MASGHHAATPVAADPHAVHKTTAAAPHAQKHE